MKKIFRYGLLIVLVCSAYNGMAQKKGAKSLLWQVSKKGVGIKPSFLFGTIHIICAEDYFWTQKMQQALDQTEQLCLEMDISQKDMNMETAALMIDFSGTTLRDYFSRQEDYDLVKKYIEDSLKQEMSVVERMKPVALYLLYSIGLVQTACAQTESYELNLVSKAQSSNKKILGLETLSQQMEALESIPTDSIIAQMIRIAKGEKEDWTKSKAMIEAYKNQDLERLNSLVAAAEQDNGMSMHQLLDQRNQNWLKPLLQIMSDKPSFIAVGAGHLKGLIGLLRKEGYQVTPL